jgi:hypothetical protein
LLTPEPEVIDYVDEIIRQQEFSERDAEYNQRRLLMFSQRNVETGTKPKVQFRSPEIAEDAGKFRDRFLAAPAKINVAAISDKERAIAGAQKQENFFYRYYYRWRDNQVFDGPLYDLASMGIGWTHLRINEAALPIIPDFEGDTEKYIEKVDAAIRQFVEDGAGDLFVNEPIDPATMYWPMQGNCIVQASMMPFSKLQQQYAKKGKALTYDRDTVNITTLAPGQNITSGTTRSDTVKLYILEDPDYCYHVLFDKVKQSGKSGGKVIGVYKNYFGTPTFFKAVGGKTGSSHPLWQHLPLLYGKYQTVPHKNLLMTGLTNAGVDATQMRYALKKIDPNAPDIEGAQTLMVTPEGILVPPDGYEVHAPNVQLGVDVPNALEQVRAEDRYGFPASLSRPEEVQATSGYDRAKQQDAVESLLGPPLGHHGAMLTDTFKAMATAIKEIGLTLSVRNVHTKTGRFTVGEMISIEPKDIIETDITVGFNSVSTFTSIALSEEGLKQLEANVMTLREYLSEIRGIDDVDDWLDQRAIEKVELAAEDRATQDVLLTIDALRGAVADEAVAEAAVQPAVTTDEDQLRTDRGPSIPTGPGSAMPVTPTPPGMAATGPL